MRGKWSLSVACLAGVLCLAALTAAVPVGELNELANNSICRSEVSYNDVPDRTPRIIKEVKCASEPDMMCPAERGGSVGCCERSSHGSQRFSCKELQDFVRVRYSSGEQLDVTVSVGCSCVATRARTAHSV